jgi:uncharacterized protein YbaA (DUF1428 family)
MARYVDGFVIPIKKKNVAKYKKMASLGCKVWMEHGALFYYECIGDDVTMPYGGLSFPKLCKLKADETFVFAFIVYKSKAHRKQVNKKVHSDPRMSPDTFTGAMPFDMNRMTMAGCKVVVQSK